MPRGAEAIIMLDMVQTIHQKARNIEERQLMIAIDNKTAQRMAHGAIEITNYYN